MTSKNNTIYYIYLSKFTNKALSIHIKYYFHTHLLIVVVSVLVYEPELTAVSDGEGEAEQQQARLQTQQRLEVVSGAAQHSQHRATQPQVEETWTQELFRVE